MSRHLALLVVFASVSIIPGCTRPAIDRGNGPGGQDTWTGIDADMPEDVSEAFRVCGDKPSLDLRALSTDTRVDQALTSLTLAEKIEQMNGAMVQFDMFKTPDNERMQLRGLYFLDGPRGVRAETGTASCFPVAVARAASWDLDLEYRIGEAMGKELRGFGYNVLLAPTVNVLRHPAWGRGQETYGEDPWLLGMLGVAFTNGVQTQVAACVKHFAGNNVEDTRMTNNAVIDQQTLREVYTRQFEMIVKEADAASVMAAYNKLNGAYCCENQPLLRDLLKDEWGFDGFVVSDWFAAKSTVDSARAGMDVEMPMAQYYQGLEQAVTQNQVSEDLINDAVRRILRIKFKFGFALLNEPYEGNPADIESDPHKELAREAARKGMVLLKNSDDVLPVDADEVTRIAVVGPWADRARLGDAGSSNVVPSYAITPFAGIQARAGRNSPAIEVVTGTDASSAAGADLAIVIVALTQEEEGEAIFKGGDRDSLDIPGDQRDLIKAVAEKGIRTVVVMEAGGPITMNDWVDDVHGVVMAWYPGMEGGHAIAEVLFGDHNFEGRVPQTWPKKWEDCPEFGNRQNETPMDYYHGYRHFDEREIEPLFPFGFGLSYTTFEFSNLVIPCDAVTETGRLVVTVDVKNTGPRQGVAVPQLYIGRPDSKIRKFVRELKGFARVSLEPDETRTVEIPIRIPDLKVWDTGRNAWVTERTTYKVEVGPNAGDLPLSGTFVVGSAPALREDGGEE
jgi:beta-glucosidase